MPSNRTRQPRITNRLDAEQRQTLIIPALGTFDTRMDLRDVTYHLVPSIAPTIEDPPVWRVLLKFDGIGQQVVVGLDVRGDIVFGRGSGDPDSPDIDLTNLGAQDRGVSRRHALMRPSANKLYLIDLNSTNGTYVNAVPVSRGMAQVIRNHDSLAFAGLTSMAEIVSSPLSRREAPGTDLQEDTDSAELARTLKLGKPKTGRETIMGVKLPMIPKSPDSSSPPPTASSGPDPKK